MGEDTWFSLLILTIGIWGLVLGSKLDTIIKLLKAQNKGYGYKVEPPTEILNFYDENKEKE